MKKFVAAIVLTGMWGTAGIAAAGAAGATPGPLSEQDRQFMVANEEGNLAELTIGQLALQRAQLPATRALAQKTIDDHQNLKNRLTALAAARGVTLPTTPNAEQQQLAATLRAVPASAFDRTFDAGQVSAHRKALAASAAEQAAGSDPDVTAYAQYYTQLATPHLTMAETDLAALGGPPPVGVPAGSGGFAAPRGTTSPAAQGVLAAGVALMAGSAIVVVRRRRDATPQATTVPAG